ncbi:MAG: hypothetical protein N2504_04005 [candidate division WOR-3 bacterium]|nr:hypothetical protein [candidate division WOR-3 bacterium]MCX7947733.1 hypothetical protein [candidate division WOR-3 bacterium]MDW8150344.1 hypothetical protein [candidate division WOR-3 bacterium]
MQNLFSQIFEVGNYREILNNLRNYNLEDYEADIVKCCLLLFLDDFNGCKIIANKYKNDYNFMFVEGYIAYNQLDELKAMKILYEVVSSDRVLDYIKLESYILLINVLVRLGRIQEIEDVYNNAVNFALSKNLFVYKSILDATYYRNLDVMYEKEEFKKILLRLEIELKNYGNLNHYFGLILYNSAFFAMSYRFAEARLRLSYAYEISKRIGSLSALSRYFLYKYFVSHYENTVNVQDLIAALDYAKMSNNYLNQTNALNYLISYYLKNNQLEKAQNMINEYEKLVSISRRENAKFLFSKVFLLEKKGNLEEAINLIQKVINMSKSKYQKMSAMIYKCYLLAIGKRLDEAYEEFLKIIENEEILYQTIDREIIESIKPVIRMYVERNKEVSENFKKFIVKFHLEEDFKIKDIYEYMDDYDLLQRIDKIKSVKILTRLKKILKYEIYAFGKLKIIISGKTLYEDDFDRPINLRVFKYFLINRDKFIPKERIFEDLWSEDDKRKATQKLHTIVSNIRKILVDGDVIKSSGGSYGFFTDERFYIDIQDFENSIKSAISLYYKETETSISKIIHAFNLYSADLLEGDLYEEWIYTERERLKQLFSQGILLLSDLLIKKNMENLAIAYLESSLFRNLDSKVFNRLLDLIKQKGLNDRIDFWNGYIEKALK